MASELLLYARRGVKLERDNNNKDASYSTAFIRISQREAMEMIESLAVQIRSNNPNTGRQELFVNDGLGNLWLLTVAVEPAGAEALPGVLSIGKGKSNRTKGGNRR